MAYVHRQRYVDALESFKKAMDEPRAYNNLGVALLGMGNAKVAAVCFEKAIELNPQYYEKATENLRQARKALAQSTMATPPRKPRKRSLVRDASVNPRALQKLPQFLSTVLDSIRTRLHYLDARGILAIPASPDGQVSLEPFSHPC